MFRDPIAHLREIIDAALIEREAKKDLLDGLDSNLSDVAEGLYEAALNAKEPRSKSYARCVDLLENLMKGEEFFRGFKDASSSKAMILASGPYVLGYEFAKEQLSLHRESKVIPLKRSG